MTEILRITGSHEQKVAKANRLRAEAQEHCPEMMALRQELIDAGMCANNLSSVARVITPNIDYHVLRDDPNRYIRKSQLPPTDNEEIRHAVQDRTSKPAVPTNLVRDSRGGIRRR